MRRLHLLLLAGLIAISAVGLAVYQWTERPAVLRVAVGPLASEDTRLVTAMAQHLARERAPVRLKLVLTEGAAASAAFLDEGKAQLAVVRTDIAMPAKAQTIAILHRDAAVVVALERSAIGSIPDLRGRAIGVVRDHEANRRLIETVLSHYEIPPHAVTMKGLRLDQVEEALRSGEVAAVVAVGTLTGQTVSRAVAAAVAAGDGASPAIVPVREADAIARRLPLFDSVEVLRGAFGGAAPRPAETMQTLGVTHRLVAHPDTDDGPISELTRLIFTLRPAIANEVPLANRIEEPDTSKSSSLPVHPGASAYYEGEVLTFMERYGDWIYITAMFGGVIGSTLVALFGRAASRSRERTVSLLNDLLAIVQAARTADGDPELDLLEREADAILVAALSKAGQEGLDGTSISAFQLGLDQARRAIAERRRWLEHHVPLQGLPRAAE